MEQNSETELLRRDARRTESKAAYTELKDARFGNRMGFRFANGAMKSLLYTHLLETEYNPDIGIILTYAGHRVSITGRNLIELYLRIEEEIVCEVVERHDFHDLIFEGASEANRANRNVFIEPVTWEII